ncbi:MAG: hypothetical protein AB8H12_04805, partial [Lewinella sp.]
MKNELDPWEVGIAEQIKGKEFSFDPQAFADFENLLQAETLGQEPGHRAPEAGGEVMSSAATTISLPMTILIIGLVSFSGWWFWPREGVVVTEPAVTTTTPAVLPAPPSEVAPAAPPTPSASMTTQTLNAVRELDTAAPDLLAVPATITEESVELAVEAASQEVITEESVLNPPRQLRATSHLTTLPIL